MKIVQLEFEGDMLSGDPAGAVRMMNEMGLLYQARFPETHSLRPHAIRYIVRGPEELVSKLQRVCGLSREMRTQTVDLQLEDHLATHGDPFWPGSLDDARLRSEEAMGSPEREPGTLDSRPDHEYAKARHTWHQDGGGYWAATYDWSAGDYVRHEGRFWRKLATDVDAGGLYDLLQRSL